MEITTTRSGDFLVLALAGRLDANWCQTVQDAVTAAIRAGEHRIRLDMTAVPYVSSAGLRVLLTAYKQLRAIKGAFAVGPSSPEARSVLELAGLEMLLAPATGNSVTGSAGFQPAPSSTSPSSASAPPPVAEPPPATHVSLRATSELHTLTAPSDSGL
ncbi:MAG: STAS domain-containing protein, partial [Burkholderiales bacterium]|nr:STAS domain-containing protein [Opitutaceae bacterium]